MKIQTQGKAALKLFKQIPDTCPVKPMVATLMLEHTKFVSQLDINPFGTVTQTVSKPETETETESGTETETETETETSEIPPVSDGQISFSVSSENNLNIYKQSTTKCHLNEL